MFVQFYPFSHFANFRELDVVGVFAGFEVESVPNDVVGIGICRRGQHSAASKGTFGESVANKVQANVCAGSVSRRFNDGDGHVWCGKSRCIR